MDQSQSNDLRKRQLFVELRRNILAARLKVTLDEQLGRDTSDTVKRLAAMKLPPMPRRPDEDAATTLRRLIPLAKLRVTLDQELGRVTPPNVKALSLMKRPPRNKIFE